MEKRNIIDQNINPGAVFGQLPNARANHPYSIQIGGGYLPANRSAHCWFEGLENAGLHYFPDKRQITGIPKNSGLFNMQMNIREYNEHGIESFSKKELTLYVEEDVNISLGEVDESVPYKKRHDDTDVKSLNLGCKNRQKKDMAAASKRGHQHVEQGKFREDDFCIKYDGRTRWYLLAVADGAGKSKYSRKGSQIACNTVVESCVDRLEEQSCELNSLTIKYCRKRTKETEKEIVEKLHDIIASSVVSAYRKIVAEAGEFGCQPNDYATTLLLCICKKFDFGWIIGSFWVGDGAICVYHKDNWYANLMCIPDCGTPKQFLTTPGIVEPAELYQRICFTFVKDFTALFLMTNGVSNPKFECNANLPCFEIWDKFWQDISAGVDLTGKTTNVGEQLLKWLGFWTPGKFDDRTIAVVF